MDISEDEKFANFLVENGRILMQILSAVLPALPLVGNIRAISISSLTFNNVSQCVET